MSEDDDIDDEEIWNWICQAAARRAGISAEKAKSILEDAGFVAHYHTGIDEAVEVVVQAARRDQTAAVLRTAALLSRAF